MDKNLLPKHIVVIPDANRRWAKEKGMLPWRGHWAGAERTKEVLQAALDLNIYCFSIWGGSYNNLTQRPRLEIKALFKIYEQYFKKLLKRKELSEHKIRVSVIGRWAELLPKSGVEAAKRLMSATEKYQERFLNFFIGYNGTDEMLAAIQAIAKEARKHRGLKITEEVLKKHLWSGHLPPVDFVVRTGSSGDPHNSVGFMMWHTANSQLYFTNTKFPDFGKNEFLEAIEEYQSRERRHGK